MDVKHIMTVIVTLIVCVTLTAGVLIPVIEDASGTVVTHENEGAESLRFTLATGDYLITMDADGTDAYIINGTDRQSLTDYSGLIYADENVGVYVDWDSGTITVCGTNSNGIPGYTSITELVYIQKTSESVTISDGINTIGTFPVPSWAYIPMSTGKYGYFPNGTEITVPNGTNVAYISETFAGVMAYNNSVGMGNGQEIPMTLSTDIIDNVLSGAKWVKAIVEDEQDAKAVKEIVLKDDDELIKLVTPTYTDGDWGFNLNAQNKAIIVSYSGIGGDITVPATVETGGVTYPVANFGLGSNDTSVVFDNSTLSANTKVSFSGSIVIRDYSFYQCTNISEVDLTNVTRIGGNSFIGCTGLTSITFPDTVTGLTGSSTFEGCTGLTSITFPDTFTSLGDRSFYGCTGLTSINLNSMVSMEIQCFNGCTGINRPLILPETLTSVGQTSFNGCSGIPSLIVLGSPTVKSSTFQGTTSLTQVLNFGNTVFSAGSNGLGADVEIRQGDDANIPAMGYLSAVEYTEGSRNTGPIYDLLPVIPLMIFIGLAVATVGAFMYFKN